MVTGQAVFGFYSSYKPGAKVPTGQTAFFFKAGLLNFYSNSQEWLTVANSKATFQGTGKINNAGSYGFKLTAIDGQKRDGDDRFRIKIWDKNNHNQLVYDNDRLVSDTGDPTTKVDWGFVVIQK